MPPTNKNTRSFTGGMMALAAVLALSLVVMLGNLFVAEKVSAAIDIAKATNWAQTVSGLYDSTPSTLASGEIDALRLDLYGRLRVDPGYAAANAWSVKNRAAANTAATASKAAGAAGVKHVCTGFMVTFASLGAPTPEIIGVQIRDGATGAGTVIWEGSISLPATAGISRDLGMTGLWLVGTAATAMTIETDLGGGANDYLTVSMQGVSIQ